MSIKREAWQGRTDLPVWGGGGTATRTTCPIGTTSASCFM